MTGRNVFTPLLLAALPLAGAAHAQNANCGPRDALIAELGEKFGEVSHGAGLASDDQLIEVWSAVDGSWTILSTNARGISCVVAAGRDWTENPAFASAFDPAT